MLIFYKFSLFVTKISCLFTFQNNNNQDNVNNNNQMSSSADATNMGNARSIFDSNKNLFCFAAKSEDLLDNELGTLMTSVMGYYLADQLPNFKHEDVPKIIHDSYKYCWINTIFNCHQTVLGITHSGNFSYFLNCSTVF